MQPHLPRLRPGQTPTADEWNTLVELLSRTLSTAGSPFGEIGVARSTGGLQIMDGRAKKHWAKITSRGTGNAYAHVQVAPDGDGTFTDLAANSDSIFGTTTVLPAREANGRVDFDTRLPLYVELSPDWDNEVSPGFLFTAPVPAGFFARITSSSSGKWKWYALTLDGSGAPVDSGSESATYSAVPHSPFGAATPAPVAGDRVWMWPSEQAGYYEFVALETFRASGSGSSRGLVPDPGSKAGTTRFLREDTTWVVPPFPTTTASDKTTIDRVSSASIAVDGSGVITLSAPKTKAYHPWTAEGFCVVSITEDTPVASDSKLTLEDTTSAYWVTDNVTGEIRVHARTPVDPMAADYELVDADDRGRLLTFTGARTITLPDPVPDFPDGWWCRIESRDATCTLVRETAATIDGATSLTIPAGQGVFLASDGTSWYTERGLEPKASAASILVGRGSKSGAGDRQEITLDGTYLGMGSGTVLTYTPDLTPDDSDTVTVVTGVTLAPVGGKLRLAVTSRDLEFVYAAGGEQIATVIGKASTVNTDVDFCLPSSCCEAGDPTASASADPTSGAAPLSVDFTGGASGGVSPYTYSWSFPGGTPSTSTSQSPTGVTYSTPGSYTATLTVTDACGRTDDATAGVTVSAAESNDISGCCPDCLFGDTATVTFTTSVGPHSVDLPWYVGASPPGWLDVAVPVYSGAADIRFVCTAGQLQLWYGTTALLPDSGEDCTAGEWAYTGSSSAGGAVDPDDFAELFDGPGATLTGDITVTVAASCT